MEATIVSINKLKGNAYDMRIDASEIAEKAVPGQFVHIKCGEENLLRRPISICDADDKTIRIVFEVRGKGTEYLSRRKAGEKIDVLGPLGNGFPLEEAGEVLFVGGGIGVPPLLYAAKKAKGEKIVLLGFRSGERVMLENDFKESGAKVLITTEDGSVGEMGFVTGLLEKTLDARKNISCVYACGPKMMLMAVSESCISRGIKCMISMEERMGCGVGACLVCACRVKRDGAEKNLHVCKDGPVFDAREVVFDE